MLSEQETESLTTRARTLLRHPQKGRFARLCIVVLGIIIGQAILYGPSLLGTQLLLPLDILRMPTYYLPPLAGSSQPGNVPPSSPGEPHNASSSPVFVPQNAAKMDLVCLFEPARRFAAAEIHAGRLPLWAPYQYSGVPFIWPKFSPFLALGTLTPSPRILAWVALWEALVGGVGAYCFFRRGLRVGFWPASFCAWCFPLTAFFIIWQGYATGLAVYWMPWLLLAIFKVTRRGARWKAVAGLALATAMVLLSGHLDVAGQVLIGSGLLALWRLFLEARRHCNSRHLRQQALRLMGGWLLGFLLAAPYWLPTVEYSATGARMQRRSAGEEVRPPHRLGCPAPSCAA